MDIEIRAKNYFEHLGTTQTANSFYTTKKQPIGISHLRTFMLLIRFSIFCLLSKLGNKLFLLALLNLIACQNCLKSTGEVLTQTRIVSAFEQIEVWDNVHLHLNDALPPYELHLKAGANLIQQISTEVQHNKLIVRNQNRCHWLRSFEVKVVLSLNPTTLKAIQHHSNGEIRSSKTLKIKHLGITLWLPTVVNLDLQADSLYMRYETASPIHIQGKTGSLVVEARGLGLFDAQHCEAEQVQVYHQDINEVRVRASKKLQVTITDRGTVAYYQNPQILQANIGNRGRLVARF